MAADFLAGQPIPELRDKGEAAMAASLASGKPRGFEVGYEAFAINGSMLGHGDPNKGTRSPCWPSTATWCPTRPRSRSYG
jgi:hypothetical protein